MMVQEAWRRTYWPLTRYLLKLPYTLLKHARCVLLHNAAGYWVPDPVREYGYCTICGYNSIGGFVAVMAALMVTAVVLFVMIVWLALA